MKSITKQVNKRQTTGRGVSAEIQSRVRRRERTLKRTRKRLEEERSILRLQGDIGNAIAVGARIFDVERLWSSTPSLMYAPNSHFHAAHRRANLTPRELPRREVLGRLPQVGDTDFV